MKKEKVLIVMPSQFGYHTDTYSYCKHLDQNAFSISYIGFWQNLPEIIIPGVEIHNIPRPTKKLFIYVSYIWFICGFIRKKNVELTFVIHHRYSLLIRLLNIRRTFIMDIRTGYIDHNPRRRRINNYSIKLSSFFYRRVSIVSESLRIILNIPKRKCTLIPLGAEIRTSNTGNDERYPRLIYIGSLNNRNIDVTIVGLGEYLKQHPGQKITYDIVGFGSTETEQQICEIIDGMDLADIVKFHGRIPNNKLDEYFRTCNIGIAFVPMVPEYDCQPTTKLFEFLLAGMPVLATNTTENALYLDGGSGILIEDSAIGFSKGLEEIVDVYHKFDPGKIRDRSMEFTWEHITKEIVTPLFKLA